MTNLPTAFPISKKIYRAYNYISWFLEPLSDKIPIARDGEIGDISIIDLHLSPTDDIAYDMADDWEGSVCSDLGLFLIDYIKDSNFLNDIYYYDFRIAAAGSFQEFKNLYTKVNNALNNEKYQTAVIGTNPYDKTVVLPGKETQMMGFAFGNYYTVVQNVNYNLLKQELERQIP